MASVTQTIPNFLGGVSNQPDDKKLPGQVVEALNAYPDPTFGLQKRPGFKYLLQLESATTGGTAFDNNDLDDVKWFYNNYASDERYIGCVAGNATTNNADIHIWNIAEKDGNGDYVKVAVTFAGTSKAYLNAVQSKDYNVVVVKKDILITNKTKNVGIVAGDTFNENRVATIKIHTVEYSAKYEVKIQIGNSVTTVTVNTRAADTATNDTDTVNNQGNAFLSAAEILTALKTGIDGQNLTNVTTEVIQNSLEITHSSASFTATAIGGKSGTALTIYQDEAKIITDLAKETKDGRLVQLNGGTSEEADDYWAKFYATDGTSGPGEWKETRAPGADKGLDSSTMPHQLGRTAKNAFTFRVIEDAGVDGIAGVFGTPRLAGDNKSNEHPSLYAKNDITGVSTGYPIQQAFFYNNRLGLLSRDNVILSKAGEHFNFYFESAQTVTAADPIDVSCATVQDATLHGVVPSAVGLLLFADTQQFVLYAADGNLSPQTALTRSLSNYKMDEKIDPVDVGTHVNFISKTHTSAGYSRIFGLQAQGPGQTPKVVDVGRSVSEFIPATITGLHANTQNSFIAMWGTDENKIYFYRTYNDGNEDLMQCWYSWQLPGKVHHVWSDADTFYSIVKTGTGNDARYTVLSATLTQTPEETIIVTSAGQQVNPHMDFYSVAGDGTNTVVDDTANNLSKVYLPYADITTLDPVIIISGNATSNFSGTTESGFTITPTRQSGYWEVPGKLLASQAANVYVGYKYNYDITLPKMYYRKDLEGTMSDYTAALTVARMKFSIGQASIVGFKLKNKGFQAATDSFTGDGSTTTFSPAFDVIDKNDVIVKKNGAKQTLSTDYTIAAHASLTDKVTVTFTTAPAAETTAANVTTPADSIEIYIDNWYTLQPTQDANYYLSDDVPLDKQSVFTVPIHQRSDNYTLRVFSDSPFPVALTSATWEGTYSPRYYRRT